MKKWTYPFLAFCLPLLLYSFTLAPTFLWGDSSRLALLVKHRQIYDFGHGYHTFHTLLGLIFSQLPLDFAVTQHFLSAFFGAMSVLLLFFLFKELGHTSLIALVGALIVSVSHSFWLYSVITETYTIHAFFLVLILLLAQKYRNSFRSIFLVLTFFFLGLSHFNHSGSVLFVLPICLIIFMKDPLQFRKILLALAAFLIGISPIFLLPAAKIGFGPTFDKIFQDTSGHIITFVSPHKIAEEFWKIPLYLGYQFPSLALLFGVFGFNELRKRDKIFNLALIVLFLLNTLLALVYFKQRQFALLITSYIIFSIWIVSGLEQGFFAEIFGRKGWVRIGSYLSMLAFPLILYSTFPALYKISGLNMINIRELPFRDSIEYFFKPDKHEVFGALHYAKEVFDTVEQNATIIADSNPGMALKYYQEISRARKDVNILLEIDSIYYSSSQHPVDDLVEYLNHYVDRPLYLADSYEPYYYITQLKKYFTIQHIGNIVRLSPKS